MFAHMNNRTRSLLFSKQAPQATPEPSNKEMEEYRRRVQEPEGSLEQLSSGLMEVPGSGQELVLRVGEKACLSA